MDEAMRSLNDVMLEVGHERSIPVYDLARELPKTFDCFYDDVHFNVEGAARAGRGLARFMVESSVTERAR
jgi:hypothetical protein